LMHMSLLDCTWLLPFLGFEGLFCVKPGLSGISASFGTKSVSRMCLESFWGQNMP
jgi:hypothetical protein